MSKKILFLITLLCAVVQGARADFSETIDIGEPRGRRTISTEHFDLEAEVGWNMGDGPSTGACLRTDPDKNAILKSRDWEIITSVEISFCNEYDAKCFIWGNDKTYITRKGNVCTIPNVNSKELILSTDDWRVVYFYSITVYYTDAFTVSYDGNGNTGGTVPDNARKNYNQDLTLSSNVLARQGFTHDGWATSPNGDKVYDFGETYKANASVTLYAHWTLNNLPVENEISSVDDWNLFCIQVENGKTYIGQTVKLMQDISVTAMAGSLKYRFKGTFDGNGHTLTFTKGSAGSHFTDDTCAPFRYVDDATIQDLVVAGNIYTNMPDAGGLVGRAYGTTTIKNCHVNTVIHSSVYGNGHHGGLVACAIGTLNITECIYGGRLFTNIGTLCCGGFVGGNYGSTINLSNVLYAPGNDIAAASGEKTITDGATFVCDHTVGSSSNCYYTEALGTVQGTAVYATLPAHELCQQAELADGKMYYLPCTVSGVEASYKRGDYPSITPVVAGVKGEVLTLGTHYAAKLNGEAVTAFPINITATGDYTLTLTALSQDLSGSKDITFVVMVMDELEGEGTAESPYQIKTAADWTQMATKLAEGEDYSGKYVKLSSDISVTVMAGTKEHPFSGTFLGNGKKLTFMAGSSGSLFSEEYCAPFRYVNNATIQDLVVDGSIHTAKKFASGLAGHTTGTTTIKNCHVGTVVYSSVSGDGTHGGFVAYPDGDVTITGSAYTGRLLTNNATHSCGGFVGWHNAKTIAVTHSLYAPSSSIPSGWTAIANGATFVRGGNAGSNCYYTEALGAAQGIHVFTDTPAGEIYNQITAADSKMYYQTCTVSGILSEYHYTGNIINVAPVVADADGTVLKVETDYTVAITPATVQERGDYALTINGVGNYGGSKTIPFSVTDVLNVNAEMTSMSTGRYLVSDNVTTNERITINGDVVLNLGEGATLTSKKGIEVSDGNRLTINGPGSLDIFGGDNNKSGIGAVEVGEIIINGGNIKVVGGALAAAIGGDHNNTKGGRITINGGVVKASALTGACIGGGSTNKKDGGLYGVCGDVVINGGQVDVETTINIGIGPGVESNEPYHNSGTLTLGWTNPDDYIKFGYFATRQKNSLNSFTFADGKMFILEGTNTIATASNIANAKLVPAAVLFDKSDNSTLLSDWEGKPLPALLADRTLYKDGKWNTLCLPFSTKLADSPLEGAIARPLTAASITGTTLNLTFGDAVDVLVAGTPYIIKWTRADDYVDDDAHNIVNPLFKGVTIDAADHSYDNAASGDLRVRFLGTYKSTEFDGTDKSILLMGGNNTLYYPASDAGLGAQRAYFKIGSDGAARTRSITAFNMSFGGDDETTGIISIANQGDRSLDSLSQSDQGPLIRWYTIDGRRLSGKPSRAGVYINNGKKVVIK